MPVVTFPEGSVVAAPDAANVMVLPLTEKLSPAAGPVGVATVPLVSALIRVAPVAAALAVPVFRAVPGVAAVFVNDVVPRRSSAVAPVTGRLFTDDFCE